MMIKEAFRANKNFIVAKIKSRAKDKFETKMDQYKSLYDMEEEHKTLFKQQGEVISNYLNDYSILKLIFKRKRDQYIGRFSENGTISTINPLTNQKLVGEVEFYLIENPYLQISDPEKRYPKNQSLNLDGIKGVFIGTDYSFGYSKKT